MKKLLIAILVTLCLSSCAVDEPMAKPEPEMYIASGHYYTSGEVITEDGNIWGYSQAIISDAPSYDNESVYALMYDAGTPDYIYDDEIVGLVGR
jgi:hypothetical protein